jgi:hypothetical protein
MTFIAFFNKGTASTAEVGALEVGACVYYYGTLNHYKNPANLSDGINNQHTLN